MAGRPRKRAREAALAALGGAVPLVESSTSWPLDDWKPPADSVAQSSAPISERSYLENWFREQMAAIEVSHAQRTARLALAGEHPSSVYAQEVRMCGVRGLARAVAARLIGMEEAQMMSWYGNDYEVGAAEMLAQVADNMSRIATSSNDRFAVKAATEYLNRRGGEEWRAPAQKLEIDDSRKPRNNVIDSSQLTYEQRAALRDLILQARGRQVQGEVVRAGLAGPVMEGEDEA